MGLDFCCTFDFVGTVIASVKQRKKMKIFIVKIICTLLKIKNNSRIKTKQIFSDKLEKKNMKKIPEKQKKNHRKNSVKKLKQKKTVKRFPVK